MEPNVRTAYIVNGDGKIFAVTIEATETVKITRSAREVPVCTVRLPNGQTRRIGADNLIADHASAIFKARETLLHEIRYQKSQIREAEEAIQRAEAQLAKIVQAEAKAETGLPIGFGWES